MGCSSSSHRRCCSPNTSPARLESSGLLPNQAKTLVGHREPRTRAIIATEDILSCIRLTSKCPRTRKPMCTCRRSRSPNEIFLCKLVNFFLHEILVDSPIFTFSIVLVARYLFEISFHGCFIVKNETSCITNHDQVVQLSNSRLGRKVLFVVLIWFFLNLSDLIFISLVDARISIQEPFIFFVFYNTMLSIIMRDIIIKINDLMST